MMYNKLNCVSIFGQRDEVRQQLTVKVTPLPEQFGQGGLQPPTTNCEGNSVTGEVWSAGRSPATTNCEGNSVTGAVCRHCV